VFARVGISAVASGVVGCVVVVVGAFVVVVVGAFVVVVVGAFVVVVGAAVGGGASAGLDVESPEGGGDGSTGSHAAPMITSANAQISTPAPRRDIAHSDRTARADDRSRRQFP
jgi:hypothetical protein